MQLSQVSQICFEFFPLFIDILCNLPLLNVAADDLNVYFSTVSSSNDSFGCAS